MMKRPVMNPSFLDDGPAGAHGGSKAAAHARRFLALLWRVVKFLFTDVLRRHRKEKLRDEVGTPLSRFLKALLYRLLFVPTLIAVLVGVLVVTATHPKTATGVMDPVSQGVYYDPVELLSLDNTKLEGWLVPVIDARRILIEKESMLHRKHAAVVLVHDFGASRQQVLPLVSPLHDAGYVVLAINLRGRGPSANIGSTFGLNEAQDVRAAVELLRRRSYVDPDAIGVLGIGTGATAALIAAEQDPRIHALILDHPIRQFQDILDERIGPRQSWLSWVRPFCKWSFEIAYRVDGEDVNLSRFTTLMNHKPVLLFDESGETVSCVKMMRIKQITQFLQRHLVPTNRAVTSLLQRDAVGSTTVQRLPDPAPTPGDTGESWPPQRTAKEMLDRAGQTGY